LLGAIAWYATLFALGVILYTQRGLSRSGLSVGEVLLSLVVVAPVNVGLWLLYEQGVEPVYRRKLGLVPTLIVGEKEERQRIRRVLEKRPSTYTPTPTWGAEH
jgi:hypothetical protein